MIIFFLFSFAGGRIYLEAEALPEQPEKKTGVRQRETFPLSLLLFVFSVVVFDPLLRFLWPLAYSLLLSVALQRPN